MLEDLLKRPELASEGDFHFLNWNRTNQEAMESLEEHQKFADEFNGRTFGWAYYKPYYMGLSGGNRWTNKKVKSLGTFFETSMKQ